MYRALAGIVPRVKPCLDSQERDRARPGHCVGAKALRHCARRHVVPVGRALGVRDCPGQRVGAGEVSQREDGAELELGRRGHGTGGCGGGRPLRGRVDLDPGRLGRRGARAGREGDRQADGRDGGRDEAGTEAVEMWRHCAPSGTGFATHGNNFGSLPGRAGKHKPGAAEVTVRETRRNAPLRWPMSRFGARARPSSRWVNICQFSVPAGQLGCWCARRAASRRSTADLLGTGLATGVGSMPGDDPREATKAIFALLPELPYLPELPGRGPAASMIGRAGGAARAGRLPPCRHPAQRLAAGRPGRPRRAAGPRPARPRPRRARGGRRGLDRSDQAGHGGAADRRRVPRAHPRRGRPRRPRRLP